MCRLENDVKKRAANIPVDSDRVQFRFGQHPQGFITPKDTLRLRNYLEKHHDMSSIPDIMNAIAENVLFAVVASAQLAQGYVLG